jgi:hypothetical protein
MGQQTWHPKWWSKETHENGWERVKESMKRDWEQTTHDFRAGGRDLDQDVDDTVKQAAGKQQIPPRNVPNAPGGTDMKRNLDWNDAEMPMAYGYGARQQYGSQHKEWNTDLESKLKTEWEGAGSAVKRKWEDVKSAVRRGYERARH